MSNTASTPAHRSPKTKKSVTATPINRFPITFSFRLLSELLPSNFFFFISLSTSVFVSLLFICIKWLLLLLRLYIDLFPLLFDFNTGRSFFSVSPLTLCRELKILVEFFSFAMNESRFLLVLCPSIIFINEMYNLFKSPSFIPNFE